MFCSLMSMRYLLLLSVAITSVLLLFSSLECHNILLSSNLNYTTLSYNHPMRTTAIILWPHLGEASARTKTVYISKLSLRRWLLCISFFLRICNKCKAGSFIMAAYVTKNDKGVLPKSQEDGKLSKTQRLTHTDILGRCSFH